MARLRFKLEINPGGHGVRLDKLGKISERAERFLRSLAEDAGAEVAPGSLVASKFYDSSFGSTVEAIVDVSPQVVAGFEAGIDAFSQIGDDALTSSIPTGFSKKTLQHYVALGEEMDSDEAVRIGLVNGGDEPHWRKLTKVSTVLVKTALEEPYRYRGALQGRLGTWYKESSYFNLRELAHGLLIKCYYKSDLYSAVYGAFEDKEAVVHVLGDVTAERFSGEPTSVSVQDINVYPRLSDADFERLAGSAPESSGGLDVVSYLDEMRNDGDD